MFKVGLEWEPVGHGCPERAGNAVFTITIADMQMQKGKLDFSMRIKKITYGDASNMRRGLIDILTAAHKASLNAVIDKLIGEVDGV